MNDFFAIAAICLILWAGSFLYFRAYLAKRTSSERILSELRDEVDKLVAEVDLATDRDVSLVEDRIKALRAILDEADRRVATMKRETERRGAEERAYSELGRRSTAIRMEQAATPPRTPLLFSAAEEEPRATVPHPAEPESVVSSDLTATSAASEKPAVSPAPAAAPRFVRAAAPVEPKSAPFFERVAELHRAGFSAELIAKRLGSTIAEVDLAIALSGKMDGRNVDGTGN